jgi:hypothetical protein
MNLYNLTLGLAAILFFVYAIYWVDDKWKRTARRRRAIRNGTFVERDGSWFNRTWKPNPGFNDEFAGVVPGTCGQIRPGEWQCNCTDQTKPCTVLVRMRSEVDAQKDKLEITDRRGAIAAQKARKKNGR